MDPLAGRETLPVLSSERFAAIPLGPEHTQDVYAIFSDPEVTRYWGHPPFTRLEEAERWIEGTRTGFRDRTLLEWGIVERGGAPGEAEAGSGGEAADLRGPVIGTCALVGWSREHRRAEIGFALGRAAWGRGIMRELLGRLLAFAFDELGLHRLDADVEPRNERSVALLEWLGFEREGLLRERYRQGGEWQHSLMMGLLEEDYRRGSAGSGGDG